MYHTGIVSFYQGYVRQGYRSGSVQTAAIVQIANEICLGTNRKK